MAETDINPLENFATPVKDPRDRSLISHKSAMAHHPSPNDSKSCRDLSLVVNSKK